MKEHGYSYQIYEEIYFRCASDISLELPYWNCWLMLKLINWMRSFHLLALTVSWNGLYAQMVAKVIADADIPI